MNKSSLGSLRETNFKEAINAFCDVIIAREKKLYQSNLESFEAYSAKLKNNLSTSLSSYGNAYQNGYKIVINRIANKKEGEEQKKFYIPGNLEKTVKNQDDFYDLLEKKEVLQAVFNYTGEMMSEVYELGVNLRQEKKQKESADVFVFLITLNPYVCSFWQGLGKAWQEQEKYEDALHAYTTSINCDPYRIGSYRDAVRCCLDDKNYDNALAILNHGLEAVDVAADEEAFKDFKKNLEAMKAYVETFKRGV